MSVQKVVIKKYGNRRLYDTSSSRYINLDQVAELVRQGAEVQVVDAKTGEDLTRVTLTQIIVEDTKDQPTGLPLELLRQLIVASDQARQDFMMWYLKTAFDSYQKVQDVVQNQMSSVRSVATAPLEAMRQFLSGTQPPNPQIDELQKRIAELESKLHSQPPPRKREKKKSS